MPRSTGSPPRPATPGARASRSWALGLAHSLEQAQPRAALEWALRAFRGLATAFAPGSAALLHDLLDEIAGAVTRGETARLEQRERELWKSRGREKLDTAIPRLFSAGAQATPPRGDRGMAPETSHPATSRRRSSARSRS